MSDNILKRMGRGLKIMYDKVANSNYVQNIKSEGQSADPNEFMPTMTSEDKLARRKNKEPDPFATDFSNLNVV